MATHNWIYARYDDSGSAYLGGMQHHEPSTSQPSSNVPPPRDIDSHEWVASANNAPTTTNILGTQMMTGYNQEHGLPTRSDYSVQNLHYSQCALMQRVDHAHAALDRCSSRSDEHPFTLSLDQFMHFPTDHRSINSNPSTSMTTSQPYIIPTNSSSFAPLSSIPIGPIRSAQQQPPNSHIARGNQTKAHRPYTGSEPPPHLQHYLDGIVLSTWWNDNECEPAGALDPFIKKNVENMWCCQMIGCEKTFQRKDRGIDHVRMEIKFRPFKCEGKCRDETCTLGFCSKRDLQSHFSKKPEECEFCGDSLTKRNLRRHYESKRCTEARQNRQYGADITPEDTSFQFQDLLPTESNPPQASTSATFL